MRPRMPGGRHRRGGPALTTLLALVGCMGLAVQTPRAYADPPGGPRLDDVAVRVSLMVTTSAFAPWPSARATVSVTVPHARVPEFREVTEAHTADRRSRAFGRELARLGVVVALKGEAKRIGPEGPVELRAFADGLRMRQVSRGEMFSDTPLEIGGWRLTYRDPRLVMAFRPRGELRGVTLRELAVTTGSLDDPVARPPPSTYDPNDRLRWRFDSEPPRAVVVSGRLSTRSRLGFTDLWRYLRPIGAVLAAIAVIPATALALRRMRRHADAPAARGALVRLRRALPYLAAAPAAALSTILVIESTHRTARSPAGSMALFGAEMLLAIAGLAALVAAPRGECSLRYRRRPPGRILLAAAIVAIAVLARTVGLWELSEGEAVRDVFAVAAAVAGVAIALVAVIALARLFASLLPGWLGGPRARGLAARNLVVALGLMAGAQVLWSNYREADRSAGVYGESTLDEFARRLESDLTVLPLNLLSVMLPAIAAFVALALTSTLSEWRAPGRTLPLRTPVALAVGVLFAWLAGTTNRPYLGIVVPLGFLLSLLAYQALARWLARRTERRNAELVALNGGSGDAATLLWEHQRDLLERALDLARLENRDTEAYESYLGDESSTGAQYLAGLASSRRRRETIASSGGPSRGSLRLPPGLRPVEAAFGSGPAGDWRGNGIVAARIGIRLALVPLLIYAYGLATRAGDQFTGKSSFGLVDALTHGVAEVSFWVVASFVLGAMFNQLPGRFGLIRGAGVAAVFVVVAAIAGTLADGEGASWTFRALEMVAFLSVLGVMLDRRTLAAYGMERQHLTTLYEIRRGRFAAAYASSAGLLLSAVAQQIAAGRADQALTELLRGAPGLLPL